MVLGRAELVTGDDERLEALRAFVEHLFPGRWDRLRPPTRLELKATTILWTGLGEASVKVRTGGPHDDPGDETWPVWAGVVPVSRDLGESWPEPGMAAGLAGPEIAAWLTSSAAGPGDDDPATAHGELGP